jgi:hypothetical protein
MPGTPGHDPVDEQTMTSSCATTNHGSRAARIVGTLTVASQIPYQS